MALFLVGLLVGAMCGVLAVGIKIMREDRPSSGRPSSFSQSQHSRRYTGTYIPHIYQRPRSQVRVNGQWWELGSFNRDVATVFWGTEVKIIPKKFVERVRVV